MNHRIKGLQAQLDALHSEAQVLAAKPDALTDDERIRRRDLPGEMAAKRAEIQEEIALSNSIVHIAKELNGKPETSFVSAFSVAEQNRTTADEDFAKKLKLRGRVRFMTGKTEEEKLRKAYTFGRFLLASQNHAESIKWCREHPELLGATHTEMVPEDGGFLVPDEFETEMIILREQYGVFRQNARMTPMGADTKWRPRRVGGLTAYFVGDAASITESKAGWDRVQLTARKLAVLTRWSSELGEDAIVDMGDTLAGEIAYAFATKEDNCGFNGDGTSTYGNINGVRNRLLDVFTTTGGTGLPIAAGNGWDEITLANMEAVAGALPEYAETPNTAWYCSKAFWTNVLVRLALASGGTTAAEVVAGVQRRFMGRPVIVSQIMPAATANSQVSCVYGDLSLAADFGDRRMTQIAVSEHLHFDTDELSIRGTERFDINVHDVGATGTAGPVVGLIMAAS